ncbi:MAG: hypothetical protein HC906_19775 [Bacteroidales bacterium]|nr:hypothetical protein [Bacteroidales bacterium]
MKTSQFLLLLLFLCLFLYSQAQDYAVDKGVFMIYGTFSLNKEFKSSSYPYNSMSSWHTNQSVNYFVAKKFF